jgi:hypothetical protein
VNDPLLRDVKSTIGSCHAISELLHTEEVVRLSTPARHLLCLRLAELRGLARLTLDLASAGSSTRKCRDAAESNS